MHNKKNNFIKQHGIGAYVVIALLAALPFVMKNQYYLNTLVLVGIYVLLAIGLNIIVGFAGLLVVGYIAFYAVGAYLFAILGTSSLHLSFWLALPLGGLAAALLGLLIGFPSIRTRGDYLAIVTLGFGEIVRLIIRNLQSITNGPQGIMGIPAPSIFGHLLISKDEYYYIILVLAVIGFIAANRLDDSVLGRSWAAIKDDEDAAASIGIDTVRLKLLAFVIGAAYAGVAGVVFASWQSFVAPESFNFFESIIVLAMVVIGGASSPAAVSLAAAALVLLPELLRQFQDYRMLLVGVALVGVMLARRKGVLASGRKELLLPGNVALGESKFPYPKQTAAASDGVALRAAGLIKRFQGLTALDLTGERVEVLAGECTGLIGPNGAGKTTLFSCLTHFHLPDSGTVHLAMPETRHFRTPKHEHIGLAPLTLFKPHQISHAGLARTFQNIRLFPSLSALENVAVALRHEMRWTVPHTLFSRKSRLRENDHLAKLAYSIMRFVESALADQHGNLGGWSFERDWNKRPGELPYGAQKALEVARALATRPHILLLDEPGAGLNQDEKQGLMNLIRRIQSDACDTVVVVEHNLRMIQEICAHVYVLDRGRLLEHGIPTEVHESDAVREAFLGRRQEACAVRKESSEKSIRKTVPALKIENLNVRYGKADLVLRNVNLSVAPGEAVAVIGLNGSGKSTLMSAVSGLLSSMPKTSVDYAGSIRLAETEILGRLPEQITSRGICLVPEGRHVFASLTVRENLAMGAYCLNLDQKQLNQEIDRICTEFPELKPRLSQISGTMSGGEQQLLAIARAMIANPGILLLDEPSLGLDVGNAEVVYARLREVNESGVSLLLVEQDTCRAASIAHRAYGLVPPTTEESNLRELSSSEIEDLARGEMDITLLM